MKIPVYEVDKKIALGFSFWNSESEIKRALDPWYEKVDYIIAVDGRYKIPYNPEMLQQTKQSPGKFSTDDSHAILERLYKDKLILVQKFGSEMEKRQVYMDIAGNLKCDALVVWDTDEIIHPEHTNWSRFFKQILTLSEFDGEEPGIVSMWCWIPEETIWPKYQNNVKPNSWRDYTRVHINPAKQRYAVTHYTFCPLTSNNADIHMFFNNPDNAMQRNPFMLYPQGFMEGIRFTTDRRLRTPEQLKFGNDWAYQMAHEEAFRIKLDEALALGYEKMYKEFYRDLGTYYFNEKGQAINYTKDEIDLFNSLDLL